MLRIDGAYALGLGGTARRRLMTSLDTSRDESDAASLTETRLGWSEGEREGGRRGDGCRVGGGEGQGRGWGLGKNLK